MTLDSELQTSDSVCTEAGAKVQLRFADGATIELGPSTQVELQDFAFDPQGEGKPSFVMHMLEGAVRSVTGKLVEQNPEAFKLSSPMGAVGIRGTTTLHLIYQSHEVHVVQELTGNHVVVITTIPDGRSITMTVAGTGVTIAADDLSPLKLYDIPPGQMQELLKIWIEENKAADSMHHFLTGEIADSLYKLAMLFISGHLGVDGLDPAHLLSSLGVDLGGLDPLSFSNMPGLGGLTPTSLLPAFTSGGPAGPGAPAGPVGPAVWTGPVGSYQVAIKWDLMPASLGETH